MARDVPRGASLGTSPDLSRTRSRDFMGASPLVQASIARDIEEDTESEGEEAIGSDSDADSETGEHIPEHDAAVTDMASSYRRHSFTGAGSRATAIFAAERGPTKYERHAAWREERSLLRDNNVIPPKHPQQGDESQTFGASLARRISRTPIGLPGGDRRVVRPETNDATGATADGVAVPAEDTPLLGQPDLPYGGHADPETLNKKWEEAVAAGLIKTTWQREAKVIGRYTAPLVLTFLLQYSLVVASVFAVGHIGSVELGAISLASMSANITGYAVYQGLATSLDTLCAQAYGSGKKKLVGLQMQRMVYFLWACTIPIGVIWLVSPYILRTIVPETETADLAGLALRIYLIGLPGMAAFESGKRFLQAQGIFNASLYVLLICSPINAFLNWLFVWKLGWGFVGAPIAVAIIDNLLPLLLFCYVRFVDGYQCWPGFTKRALHNWGPMVRLALPGLLMVEAECLAFEVLTLASSYFGTKPLAAQSVLATASSLTWQIPFPLSIATSTRIANLIGATLADAAKTTAKVGMAVAVFVGLFNLIMLSALREYIPRLFSSDEEVWRLVSDVLPVCAAFQLFDALAAMCNGVLRGLGRQEIGGYVQVFCYYAIAMPISMGTAFGAGWNLHGLWTGVAIALFLFVYPFPFDSGMAFICIRRSSGSPTKSLPVFLLGSPALLGGVTIIESIFISRTSWQRSVDDALRRNDLT